ncbi:MAG: DUF1150 domain-containing protein [Silicimonas sp.]|jgi:hypothetical protein|nr:DUF1150 domain-containing protein [Silicimonas sp.]
MNTKFDFNRSDISRLVYIRPVDVADLPSDMQEQVEGRDKIYGVHSSDGLCLALVKDRQLAFALARQNDFAPVGVH